jgi:acyl dehydratase
MTAMQTLAVGNRAEQGRFGPITMTDIVRYQGASGDMNPIHHDVGFAQRAGFPSPFAVGMLQAGVLANFACEWLGYDKVRSIAIRFRDKVWPGDVVTLDAEVRRIRDVDGIRLAEIDLTCAREGGGTALSGTATFVID